MAWMDISERVFAGALLERASCGVEERRELLPLIRTLVEMAEAARREGVLCLERYLPELPPLLRVGIQDCVDGVDPELINKKLSHLVFLGRAEGKKLLEGLVVIEGVLVHCT